MNGGTCLHETPGERLPRGRKKNVRCNRSSLLTNSLPYKEGQRSYPRLIGRCHHARRVSATQQSTKFTASPVVDPAKYSWAASTTDQRERRRHEDCSATASTSEADALNSAVRIADVCHARRELGRILMLVDVRELPGLL